MYRRVHMLYIHKQVTHTHIYGCENKKGKKHWKKMEKNENEKKTTTTTTFVCYNISHFLVHFVKGDGYPFTKQKTRP